MIKFANKIELLTFLNTILYLDSGSQGVCYYNFQDNKVYKIFSEYFEDNISSFDVDFYLDFNKAKNETFIWMKEPIFVDNLCVGYTTEYVNGVMLNSVNPLVINLDVFVNMLRKVKRDIEVISKQGIAIEDLMYNIMYSIDGINIIDFLNYYFSNYTYEKLVMNNTKKFNMVIYYFLIDTYFEEFVNSDKVLLEMYKEKDVNLEKFITLLKTKLSEFMGYKINVLGQAYPYLNKCRTFSSKYIRNLKKF